MFVEELRKIFALPKSEVDLESELLQLHQGDQPICCFISDFHTLAAKLNWGDAVLYSVFMEGIADYIRDEMVSHEAPKPFDATIDLALKIDQHVLLGPHPDTCHFRSFRTR